MGSTTSNGVFNENENKKMTKEPKLPHKLKWGDRTAARVDEVGAWSIPEDSKYRGLGGGDVFMKKPRAGAYYKYIKIKNIVREES